MKIILTGDTFGNLPEIDEYCDIFIHCGNFCPVFKDEPIALEIEEQYNWIKDYFNTWLDSLEAKHKIVIAGDADTIAQWIGRELDLYLSANYLRDEYINVENLLIYGSPMTPHYFDNLVNGNNFISFTENHFKAICKKIHGDTDIFISRCPLFGYMDKNNNKNIGSKFLLDTISNIDIQLFCFSNSIIDKNMQEKNVTESGFQIVNCCYSDNSKYKTVYLNK